MAAYILSKGQINHFNGPQISDVEITSKILTAMGRNIKSNKDKLERNIKSNLHQSQNYSLIYRVKKI